jgi:hypothetical protein
MSFADYAAPSRDETTAGAFGLLLGISAAATINYYAQTDPVALRQPSPPLPYPSRALAASALRPAATSRFFTERCSGYCWR